MRYALLLSGGVDSSTALAELARAGHHVTAYYLKVWLEDELDYLGACPWEEDLSFARAVCEMFDVSLVVVPLQLEYHERVVQYTLSELAAGRTPSPDIFCNERIKFGAFIDYLRHEEPDNDVLIATGHYAQIVHHRDHAALLRSPDPVKDQSYFLAHLGQEQLQRIAFPIGGFAKDDVRRRAHEYRLPNRDRPDSQGICFLGKIRYPDFVRHYLGEKPGAIVELESGRVLGEHPGFWFYTIGQRTGLGLGGGPWYVVRKDTSDNVVFVSHSNSVASRARREFLVRDLSWTWKPPQTSRLTLKIRHGPALIDASIRRPDEQTIHVTMDRADRGVAPGQFAVFYDGPACLGCGKIQHEQVKETVCTFS
jgi:tRNA (5-methylaminomethyl-2-thiouridylate)-methyltransferase